MSKEKWYEEEHQKDAAMVYDLLAKSQFAVEYQSRDAIEAECVARKAILDRFESLRKPAGRERGEEGAGGPFWTAGYLQGVSDAQSKMREISASAEPQRAFGPIREEAERVVLAYRRTGPDIVFWASGVGKAVNALESALLGEALPTSGEAEQSHQVTNHEEAFELAQIKKSESNLARCYLELRAATPGATVQPQARPMKLRAKTEGAGYFGSVQVEVYENEKWISCHNAKTDGVWKEIADRLNFFEPPHQGEAT